MALVTLARPPEQDYTIYLDGRAHIFQGGRPKRVGDEVARICREVNQSFHTELFRIDWTEVDDEDVIQTELI